MPLIVEPLDPFRAWSHSIDNLSVRHGKTGQTKQYLHFKRLNGQHSYLGRPSTAHEVKYRHCRQLRTTNVIELEMHN
jgi:hypothetical protein